MIVNKVNCFEQKLNRCKETIVYKEARSDFKDTFDILKKNPKYFGIPSIVQNSIDEAIYFNKDSTECLIIVLQRISEDKFFGSARIVSGYKINARWKFNLNLEYNFDDSYFDLFRENSFDNISLLANYNLLVAGKVNRKECDIDYEYWFTKSIK